jgi:hypothetical protein
MSDDRLPTHLLVGAALARCSAHGTPAAVLHKGERSSGVLLVKISRIPEGARLLTQQRDIDGVLGWVPALANERMEEMDADAYIARAIDRDPDLWAIEIEDPKGQNPFDPKEVE